MQKCLLGAIACLASLAWTPAVAGWTVDWNCLVLDGSLSEGAFVEFEGEIDIGGCVLSPTTANFIFPHASVGNGTGQPIGSIVIVCDVYAPEECPALDDITIDLVGQIVPGQFATKPFIAWTEVIKDITDPNAPVTLVTDSGIAYSQPGEKHYVFDNPTHAIRIKETFILDGVTYTDDTGLTQIDETAVAALTLIEKELSFVPEPGQLIGLAMALVALASLRARRGR
jgi:hypothetical protein